MSLKEAIGVILMLPFAIVFWAAIQFVDTFLPHG